MSLGVGLAGVSLARSGARRFSPSFVLDVARSGELVDTAGGAAITFTRASAAWAFDSSGKLTAFASGVPRIVPSPVGIMSVLTEPQRTNKCTNHNANPTSNGGVAKISGDPAGTVTLVSDVAALASAGLGVICDNGNVYKADNSAGVGGIEVYVPGGTGNLNQHTLSVYARGTGTCGLGSGYTPVSSATTPLSSNYVRLVRSYTPINATDWLRISVAPGAVVYFILNQLEEGAYETAPIVTAGSSVTRVVDLCQSSGMTIDGSAGGLRVDCVIGNVAQTAHLMAQVQQGGNDFMGLRQNTTATLAVIRKNAVANGDLGHAGTVSANQRIKTAMRWSVGDNGTVRNGGSVSTNTRNDLTIAPTTLAVGGYTVAGASGVQYTHSVALYPSALTDAQLQAITS